MAQILVNSPYLIQHVESGLESITVDLWVAQGLKSTLTSGAIAYSLQTKAYNAYATVDIAQLAKDYIESQYASPMWVAYRITKTVSGTTTQLTSVTLAGLHGYGYYGQGANPQAIRPTSITLLQDNTEIYVPKGYGFTIPVLTETNQTIDNYYNGVLQSTPTAATATDSSHIITYFNNRRLNYTWGTNEKALWSTQRNVDDLNTTDANFTRVDVGTVNTRVDIKEVDCTKHDPIKVHFLNKYGAIQAIWFFGRSYETSSVSRETYQKNVKTINLYDPRQHSKRIMGVSGNTKRIFNTGFYPENFNEVFKQLLNSDRVWIYEDNEHIPVNVATSEMRYKTSLGDKLINYEIEFEYAFNEINNIK